MKVGKRLKVFKIISLFCPSSPGALPGSNFFFCKLYVVRCVKWFFYFVPRVCVRCALLLVLLSSGMKYSIMCSTALAMSVVYVPFCVFKVVHVALICIFPEARLYTKPHGLESAVREQKSFQDLRFPSWRFAW